MGHASRITMTLSSLSQIRAFSQAFLPQVPESDLALDRPGFLKTPLGLVQLSLGPTPVAGLRLGPMPLN
jgi:hypothetical protein